MGYNSRNSQECSQHPHVCIFQMVLEGKCLCSDRLAIRLLQIWTFHHSNQSSVRQMQAASSFFPLLSLNCSIYLTFTLCFGWYLAIPAKPHVLKCGAKWVTLGMNQKVVSLPSLALTVSLYSLVAVKWRVLPCHACLPQSSTTSGWNLHQSKSLLL